MIRGRRVPLHDGEHIVWRDAAADVCLDNVSVSRNHARLLIDGLTARLGDLGSKNGTTVGGVPVSGQVILRVDDRLAFGSVVATYRSADSDLSTETHSRTDLKRR